MDKEALKQFILDASRATYASGDKTIQQKQIDGSTTIEYQNGPYKYHDNYFGGEPYGGREVVFLADKPIWLMVYYGSTTGEANAEEVYPFLMAALSNSTIDMPYRGPAMFEKDNWRYENQLSGEVDEFSGTEKIFRGGACVYEANYLGGSINL